MRRKEKYESTRRYLSYIICTLSVVTAFGCSATDIQAGEISSYEECIEAGYPMMKSMPPRCSTGDGRIFIRGVSSPYYVDSIQRGVPHQAESQKACRDMCGNGRCEEIVCEAVGCPCAETPASCPSDCSR